MSVTDSTRGAASNGRRSDLRFAGMISAGMIATVLTIGALLAPAPRLERRRLAQRARSQPDGPPERAARQGRRPGRASFAVDRPGRVPPPRSAAAPRGRRPRRGRPRPGASPRLASGLGLTVGPARSTARAATTPVANASDDSDGDGMPDVWERSYGLNPNDAADATEDSDGDGLDNRTELRTRTAPTSTDTDRNGVADGDEDADRDGLRNLSSSRPAPTRRTPTPTTTASATPRTTPTATAPRTSPSRRPARTPAPARTPRRSSTPTIPPRP